MRRDPVGPGDRIRVVHWHVDEKYSGPGYHTGPLGEIRDVDGAVVSVNDNVTVPPGTEGTVTDVLTAGDGSAMQVAVVWDNGRRLSFLPDVDEWEAVEG